MANKKYYWLKLKENFFDDDAISWLEEQKNGKEYALFYLKLCLKSLKNDGALIRKVGDMIIPYDVHGLAAITKTDVDTTIVALELLQKIGLISITENKAFYMTQLESMVGSETDEAQRKRKYRLKVGQCPIDVPKMSRTNVRQSIEYRDKSIDIEKDIETEKTIGESDDSLDDSKQQKKNKGKEPFEQLKEKKELYTSLKGFAEMRKKIKKPLTNRAEELLLHRLDEMADDEAGKIAILNQSIMNCWQGVFPIKEEKRHDRFSARDDGEESIDWGAFDGA